MTRRLIIFATVFAATVSGQGTTAGDTSTSTNGTATSTTTTTTPGSNGVTPSPTFTPRPIFLSGVVMTNDGSPLPRNVNVVSVCGGVHRTMAHTSVSGDFSFQWGNAAGIFEDASQPTRTPRTGGASGSGSRSGTRDPMTNCDLTAETPGYTGNLVSLSNRAGQENYDVGTILIHLIAAGEGRTVSVLSLQAPRGARNDFEKGTRLASAHQPEQALVSFQNAVKVYPQYADAWLEMGKVEWELRKKDDARAAFEKALDLDNKLVGPWQQLGFLACDDSRWEEALHFLDQAVRLDSMDSPKAWYYSAVANYKLGHYDLAERAVRAEIKLEQGANPHANYLLGLVLIARHNPEGAAEALRSYIAAAPTSPDVADAKRALASIETTGTNGP